MKKIGKTLGVIVGIVALVSVVVMGWVYFDEICEFFQSTFKKFKKIVS